MPKKRANGEGSIRKRKDGRWEGRYTAGNDPTTGKPIHKSVLAKTQSEAKEKLKQAIAEAEKLDMSRAKSYTLGAWIKLWYEVYAEPRLREKTKHYYLNYIDNHIVPELGGTPLEKLTTIQIQKFYNDLQKSGRIQRYTHIKLKDKGLSTRVVRGIHTLLNNCLEQAVAERLLLANPAKGCRLPKLEKREMKILPEDKIGPYLAEAERRGLLAAFYLELTTGLRRGELLALLWTDLDAENMTISVNKQVNRINGELVVSQPKTPNSIRKLAIPQRAVELLVEEHAKHLHSPYLFVSPKTGTMFDPDSFRHTHEKIPEGHRRGAHQVSRPQTHLRHAVPQVRRGRQDAVRRTGTLRRGLYPQHLHPRHGGNEALRRRHHRQRHQPDHVAHKNSRRGTDDAIRPSPVLS